MHLKPFAWFLLFILTGCDEASMPEGTTIKISDVNGCQTYKVRSRDAYDGYVFYTRCGGSVINHRQDCRQVMVGKIVQTVCSSSPQIIEDSNDQ